MMPPSPAINASLSTPQPALERGLSSPQQRLIIPLPPPPPEHGHSLPPQSGLTTFPFLRFGFVSNFEFRISNFTRAFCLCSLLLLSVVLSGCVTKAKADAQARAAFLAGQQQALERMQQTREAMVTLVGPVKNSSLPWTADLTLAKAVIAAEYYAPKDPAEIVIMRAGQAIRVDPSQLLSGEDIPLQPRDVVELK